MARGAGCSVPRHSGAGCPGGPGPREGSVTRRGGQASAGVACPCSGSHLLLSLGDFFFKPENWGCPGSLGLVQTKLFSKTLLPLMVLEAANGFLLASASSLVCRGGISGLASCAPLIWTSQEPYRGIFTMPLQREISFSFFQSWQEQSSACLLQFSASFLLLLPAKDTVRIFAWC